MLTSSQAPQSPRFQIWISISIYSYVSILVQASTIAFQTPDTDWAIDILSVSIVFSLVTLIAHLTPPEIFVGPHAKAAATMLPLLAWVTSFPRIVPPK